MNEENEIAVITPGPIDGKLEAILLDESITVIDPEKEIAVSPELEHELSLLWEEAHGLEKIDPSRYFITAGEYNGSFRSVIMRPIKGDESPEQYPEGYRPLIHGPYGFSSADEAKQAASETLPCLPVLVVDDQFMYPSFKDHHRVGTILKQAEDRRVKRGMVRQSNPKKIHYGKFFIKGSSVPYEKGKYHPQTNPDPALLPLGIIVSKSDDESGGL